jgi:hypothetical protein
MRSKFFVIRGALDKGGRRRSQEPVRPNRERHNLAILQRSPCLGCQLYVEAAKCVHVEACSRIDEFQRVAAVHCTLFKDHDVFSILKI